MTHDNQKDDDTKTMAELLDAYDREQHPSIQVGDRIKGKIISIGRDHIFVDTGHKLDGVIERSELADDEGNLTFEVGDTIDAFVMSKRGGEIRLSKAISGIGGLAILQEAHEKGVPIEGKVLEQVKGGYRVEVVKRRAFCPFSQMDLFRVEDPNMHIGKTYLFLIAELEEDGNNIIVSRRTLLEQERLAAKTAFFDRMEVGAMLEGTVSRIMPYGALVELAEGIEGMVHVSEMSWSRTLSPEDILHIGEKVTVKVLAVEDDEKTGRKRISLSMKQIQDDPWNSVLNRFKPGDRLRAKVTHIAEFGVFVEIAPGVEGLVHISEMSYTRRVKKPDDMVSPGDEVDVMIKDISPESRRISLSMKEAEGDPWIGIAQRYRLEQVVAGVLEKKERFGYFIRLEPGVTGLLPKSVMVQHHDAAGLEKLREGDAVTVTIERVDAEQRKISLAPGDKNDEGDWTRFSRSGESRGSFSSLGDKLQKALDRKKK
ncbi:MAG TPA: 30S ribosomal protein S1 [Deltaproteobacteria bacterium]|nr:30S ribosomal protein S1 [Deltaproteobacteria bacterium]HPR54272.1 30S ribosomal protein S1 [Deltaproteobacteria bacterium]HXK45816.1 30S ribosomal protein S1 [Deltaproteobacteria bacterium]